MITNEEIEKCKNDRQYFYETYCSIKKQIEPEEFDALIARGISYKPISNGSRYGIKNLLQIYDSLPDYLKVNAIKGLLK